MKKKTTSAAEPARQPALPNVVHSSDADPPGTSRPGEPVPVWLRDPSRSVFTSPDLRVLSDEAIEAWWKQHAGRDYWGEPALEQHTVAGKGGEAHFTLHGDGWIESIFEGPDGFRFGILRNPDLAEDSALAFEALRHLAPAQTSPIPAPAVAPPAPIIKTAFDRETGRQVPITVQLKARAQQVITGLIAATIDECEALRQIKEEKLYLPLGYDCFDAWVDQGWHLGRTRAYQYIQVAKHLPRDLVEAISSSGRSITKLIALAALPQADLEHLLEQKTLLLADGQVVDLDQLREMPGTQVDLEVTALRRGLKEAERQAEQGQLTLEQTQKTHQAEVNQLVDDFEGVQQEKSRLEAQLQELSRQPTQDGASKTIARLQGELKKADEHIARIGSERDRAQDQLRGALQGELDEQAVIGKIRGAGADAVKHLRTILDTLKCCADPGVLVVGEASAANELVRVLLETLERKVSALMQAGED